MDLVRIINTELRRQNKTKSWLLERLGYKKPWGGMWRIFRGSMSGHTFERICDILGLEIVRKADSD